MRPDVKFQLVGAEPPADLTGPNVEYPGIRGRSGPYLRRANLVIAPMPFGFGMSTKIVSALAFGKTVLATPQGAGAIPRKYRQLVVVAARRVCQKNCRIAGDATPVDAGRFRVALQ